MVQIEGKYELQKNEHFIDYLLLLGPEVTEEFARKLNDAPSVLTVTSEGGRYTFYFEIGSTTYSLVFSDGETFVDQLLPGIELQNVATVEGSKITLKSTFQDGRSGERIYQFSEDGLTVAYTATNISVAGKRIYKRI